MSQLPQSYDVTKRDLAKGRNLKIGAWTAPVVLGGIPAAAFTIMLFLFGATPPVAATILFLGIMATVIGLAFGLGISGFLAYRHSKWTKELREKIAADGIKAGEIDWFRNELKTSEKQALRDIERRDLLLADAYRETLASRLTATRIVKASTRELLLAKRRQGKLKYLKSENSERFAEEIGKDVEKISGIQNEAKQMLAEAESRLQMIEAAASRGGVLADSRLALERLTARTAELPMALEAAKMEEDIREELEKETFK